ncbi:methyltransferase, FkbM family [Variovorax sp. OV329]|nr:methyltransferase, FkbM family [Variovorax sp. OV329]
MFVHMSYSKHAKELARWAFGLPNFYAARLFGKRPRFLKVTPGVFSTQLIYDRDHRSFFSVRSRDDIDVSVVRQIFVQEDYAVESQDHAAALQRFYDSILESGRRPLIIDCGGNTGLATRYFAETYPGATVVCVEPEEKNMAMARLNNPETEVSFLLAGIGNSDAWADIVDPGRGNWAYRTETSDTGKTQIISVNSILGDPQYQDCTPFIIKIDIEGFEENLFEKNTEWLDAFPLLIIELHDWMLPKQATSHNFLQAISQKNRDFIYRNENVFSISNTFS